MTDSERKQNVYLGMQGIIAENFPGWEILANVKGDGQPLDKSDDDVQNIGVYFENKILIVLDTRNDAPADFMSRISELIDANVETMRKQSAGIL